MIPKLPETHQVNIHLLSPVHIGSGQELDPFSYIIRNKMLLIIDFMKWMESYSDPDTLYAMMDSDDFIALRSFVSEKFNDENAIVCSIPIDDPPLFETYQRAVRKKDPRNQVLISPFARNELTKKAYIPGSSIKGAIRTALANQFVKPAKVTKEDAVGRDNFNRKIFGTTNNDPMKNLKVSDIALEDLCTVIVEAREYPLNPNKSLTPKGHTEAAISFCHSGKPVVYPFRVSLAPFELYGTQVDLPFLIKTMNQFYVEKYSDEFEKFYNVSRAREINQEIALMNKVVKELKTNEALIRIGHFSHVECVTLDEVRNPRTKRGKDGKPLYGYTRTLANGLYPFGWVKLEFLELDSKPLPERKWPFSLHINDSDIEAKQKYFASLTALLEMTQSQDTTITEREPVVVKELSTYEKIMKELEIIKIDEMGRLGSLIQIIEDCESDEEKGKAARAIKEKMSKKAFKKHKKKDYLKELIEKHHLS